jgi:uncharacterized membrane protein
VVGAFFWFLFTIGFGIIYGLSEAAGGPSAPSGAYALVGITGLAMIFGIPAGIIGEIVRWRRGKKTEKILAPRSPQQTAISSVKYCTQCGKEAPTNLTFCGHCGTRL